MSSISILGLSFYMLVFMFISTVTAQTRFPIGNTEYFTDLTTKRNRIEALQFCEDGNAELAKITNSALYFEILLNIFASGENIYWVDGIYSATNPNAFTLNEKCTSGSLDLVGVPYKEADAKLCLAIERGPNPSTSTLRSMTCSQLNYVLCSQPKPDGCESTTDGPTTPDPDITTELPGTPPNIFEYFSP